MPTKEIHELRERAKELRCLYRLHEIVSQRGQPPAHTFLEVLEVIPEGWQRPESTGARIEYFGRHYVGPGFSSTGETIAAPIRLDGTEVGRVEVSDASIVDDEATTFLDEEKELLRNIAHRLGEYLEWKHTELLGERSTTAGVHWRWREGYAEAMAAALDAERFGVSGVYLGGSTEGGNAGPGSDIDLIVMCDGSEAQREQLRHWFEGWSLCLAELALQQTGYGFPGGILNVQWMTEAPDLRHRPDLRVLKLGGQDTAVPTAGT
ncbi:MAG: nucleotidyltransferase domain-containing protein [Phycisphaerales bacterium]|nr:nucleotidyltransferase domain-containing protein [Phycisphaerales bacterium]